MSYDHNRGVKAKKLFCGLCGHYKLCRFYKDAWLCYRCYRDVKKASVKYERGLIDYFRIGGCG